MTGYNDIIKLLLKYGISEDDMAIIEDWINYLYEDSFDEGYDQCLKDNDLT